MNLIKFKTAGYRRVDFSQLPNFDFLRVYKYEIPFMTFKFINKK